MLVQNQSNTYHARFMFVRIAVNDRLFAAQRVVKTERGLENVPGRILHAVVLC